MTDQDRGADVTLRPFHDDDVGLLGVLFGAGRASMELFEEPYTTGEHIGYIAGLSVGCVITVAEKGGAPVGFLSYAKKPNDKAGLISHIFVDPKHQHQGIGRLLLRDALARFPRPLELWCFEANSRARALYETEGFVAAERTDGSNNDEKLPDIRYELR